MVFARTWQMVGHVSQLATAGDLITATVGRERIVVANDGTGINAFYNVCQHRGHQLVLEEQANMTDISCPYHAWLYDLSGRLLNARRLPAGALGDICVPPVRVETIAGYVFVNLDDDAPSLADTAPGVEAALLDLAPAAPQAGADRPPDPRVRRQLETGHRELQRVLPLPERAPLVHHRRDRSQDVSDHSEGSDGVAHGVGRPARSSSLRAR